MWLPLGSHTTMCSQMPRPFRFGITLGGAPSRTELVEMVKQAEGSGFSVAATADHISDRHAVFPLLSTIAEVSSMRVSSMVIANDYHHPIGVARDAATLDILSEGRFELGIGTGWIKAQYDAAGLPYDDGKTKVDRFEEAIEVIKGCWAGSPFTFAGEHYQVTGVACPRPVQVPRPPILIAGSGRRMLGIAGREADIVGISGLGRVATRFADFGKGLGTSAARIDRQIEWIRQGAGARFAQIEISVMAHHLDPDPDFDSVAVRLAGEWGTTPDDVLRSPHVFLGDEKRLRDSIVERRERHGISYFVFLGAQLPHVAKVVESLVGE